MKNKNLGGAGAADIGKTPSKSMKAMMNDPVQNVGPETAAMQPSKRDPLDGCCGVSEVKAAYKK